MDRNSNLSKFQDALRAYQLNAEKSQILAKVTKAPLSVIQSSSLSTQATTSLPSGATSSIQSLTTAGQATDDFERSYSVILLDFDYMILPKTKLIDELLKRPDIRLSRINSSIDMYFATEEVFREKLARVRKQWTATDHNREMQHLADKLNKPHRHSVIYLSQVRPASRKRQNQLIAS